MSVTLNRRALLASENLAKAPLSPMAVRISWMSASVGSRISFWATARRIFASHAALSDDVLRGSLTEGRML